MLRSFFAATEQKAVNNALKAALAVVAFVAASLLPSAEVLANPSVRNNNPVFNVNQIIVPYDIPEGYVELRGNIGGELLSIGGSARNLPAQQSISPDSQQNIVRPIRALQVTRVYLLQDRLSLVNPVKSATPNQSLSYDAVPKLYYPNNLVLLKPRQGVSPVRLKDICIPLSDVPDLLEKPINSRRLVKPSDLGISPEIQVSNSIPLLLRPLKLSLHLKPL
ncbi:MAG: hypothetical protein ACJ754_19360 [Pyrinomonadaceae bacterium]